MADEQLNSIKERLNRTSKGNWKFGVSGNLHSTETHEHVMFASNGGSIIMKYVDMQFVENAKQDISDLIAEVERLKSL